MHSFRCQEINSSLTKNSISYACITHYCVDSLTGGDFCLYTKTTKSLLNLVVAITAKLIDAPPSQGQLAFYNPG